MKGLEIAFTNLFKETLERQGWQIPKSVQNCMISILVKRVDQPKWQPPDSYTEQYFKARTPTALKMLGDVCWFTRAVFPQLGEHRGMQASYYTNLGQNCYSRTLQYIGHDLTLELMIRHFDFLAEVTWTVIHSQGRFREMWED